MTLNQIILIIFASISLMCIIIITIFYVKKMGIFNKKINDRDDNNTYIDAEEIKDIKIDDDPFSKYDINDDDFDIKPYLLEKGFKTNYQEMTEEEKNEVMVYLMTLRYEHKISEEQCKLEEIKLWKK